MSPQPVLDPTSDCDAIRELIPDYAFGLITPDEKRLVESNLASCPEAAADLADFKQLQDEMRAGVRQMQPSAHLGERLMAAIAEPPVKIAARRRRFNVAWLAAAAAIIALVLTNAYWLTRVNDLTQQGALASPTADAQGKASFVLNTTNGLRWVRLPSSQQNGSAAAFMMWSADSQIGLLYAHDLPSLVVGKTYTLWLTRGKELVQAGTFRVDEDGKGALLFHITEPIDEYTWARITDESGGTVVVTGKIST